MKGARYVVAVHTDPDAPLLEQVDAAIMGDPAKVAKELAEAFSKTEDLPCALSPHEGGAQLSAAGFPPARE